MQGFDLLIKILEGATVIIGVLVGGYKFFRNVENKIDGIGEDIKEIKDDLKENTIITYKNAILNDKLDKSERIEIGHKYIDLGGNGVAKKIVNKLEDEVYDEINKK